MSADTARFSWYSASLVKEDNPSCSTINVHLGCIHVNGVKKRKIVDVSPPVERAGDREIKIQFYDGDCIEIAFADSARADKFERDLKTAMDKKHEKHSKHNSSQSVLPHTSELSLAPTSAMKHKKTPHGWDDFGAFSRSNNLPATTHSAKRASVTPDSQKSVHSVREVTPSAENMVQTRQLNGPSVERHEANRASVTPDANNASSDRKRRCIDNHVYTQAGTPEKSLQSYPMRRAAQPARSLLLVAPQRPAAPQSSAAYRGYRHSENFGLKNLGNTCYLNAVMQAFCSLREFVQALKEVSANLRGCELLRCSTEILSQMSSPGGVHAPLSPVKLRERIAVASPMFGASEQQDAHEFLLEYVNQLHDELLGARGTSPAEDAAQDNIAVPATQLYFDSEVQKRLVCTSCQRSRELSERFRDFSLDFVGPHSTDRCAVGDMLASYFADEGLDAKCEHCGHTGALMEKALVSPPRVLVLHLKRFVPNYQMRRYDKQHQRVDIPLQLDLTVCLGGAVPACAESSPASPFQVLPPGGRLPARPLAGGAMENSAGAMHTMPVADNDRGGESAPSTVPVQASVTQAGASQAAPLPGADGPLYKLRALVAHEGSSPRSGHYVCYSVSEAGVWRLHDDSVVSDLPGNDPTKGLGQKAYILFYVLQGQSMGS